MRGLRGLGEPRRQRVDGDTRSAPHLAGGRATRAGASRSGSGFRGGSDSGGHRCGKRSVLHHEGLVVAVPNSDYSVRDFDLREMDMWYEIRMALEALSVQLAAVCSSLVVLDGLSEFSFHPPRRPPSRRVRRTPEEFHESLAAAGGNTVLERFLREVN